VLIAELLVYASTGLARILERAFAESGVTPPEVSLNVETFLATVQIPSKWIENRLTNAQDRAVVRSMYEELRATGRVEATLPEDDRVVRDLYALQVAGPRADRQAAARSMRVGAATPAKKPRPASVPADVPASKSPPRVYLAASDGLEAAPSIGPRSAQRFSKIGILTVGDFLAADPATMADALSARGLDAETLRLWQQQARLVMDVPGLRGTHAQLLTGAGFLEAAGLARASNDDLAALVHTFAASPEGQRILRKAEPPTAEKIKGWIDSAAAKLAA
jgi:predicted flap endonuclease-1-like 5' DNA nuclease